jgi:hypothetical protein
MPILEYVPPLKKVIDKRSDKGDYYKAKCDVCGTEFYPKRRSAKYCTPNCKVIQHRIDVANGKIIEKSKSKTEKPVSDKYLKLKGIKKAYDYIKSEYNTFGDRNLILDGLKYAEIGEIFSYGEIKILKKSPSIYLVEK